MAKRNLFGASERHKKMLEKRNEDVKGKNVCYGWLRIEANLSKGEICQRLGMTYAKMYRAFENPANHMTEFHIERIAYCLRNRTMKEIRIALSEKHSITKKWYESLDDE